MSRILRAIQWGAVIGVAVSAMALLSLGDTATEAQSTGWIYALCASGFLAFGAHAWCDTIQQRAEDARFERHIRDIGMQEKRAVMWDRETRR